MKYDYLIVGAGLFGATFTHFAIKQGKKCLVIDRRSHIGGNVYCKKEAGINVHVYGPHIFYTSDKKVWDFVNQFSSFNRFTNSPLANYKGQIFNLPFNMNTFNRLWGVVTPEEAKNKIAEQQKDIAEILRNREPSNLEEQALSLVGSDIYEILIKGYTEKQWGRKCTDLPPSIIKRLPVRFNYDNNYYNDIYQGIPIDGYNPIIEALLDGSDIKLGISFEDIKGNWREFAEKLVYTGELDAYFDYSLGKLDWRTVNFETFTLDTPNFQGNAVVNFTDIETPWTRVVEHKHFEVYGDDVYSNPLTIISREYSTEYQTGMEPFYPINDDRNTLLAEEYRELASHEKDIIFGGRLGDYKYYDMASAIAHAMLKASEEFGLE